MRGITLGVQSSHHGLMPGTRRASVRMSASSIRRVREFSSQQREIINIQPLGSGRESLTGRVTASHTVDIAKRFGLGPRSLGAQLVGRSFPGLEAVQITIIVDDIDIDPAAVDLLSYTFWCELSNVAKTVVPQDVVKVDLEPARILGGDRYWIAESIEIM